jgi:hypothetical protein
MNLSSHAKLRLSQRGFPTGERNTVPLDKKELKKKERGLPYAVCTYYDTGHIIFAENNVVKTIVNKVKKS